MYYHDIRTNDMLNGEGLRTVIFVSGCSHHCEGCHNPETWNPNCGKLFTIDELNEIEGYLSEPHISGLTLSGGDPLYKENRVPIYCMVRSIKRTFGDSKTIWLYTGYTWEEILDDSMLSNTILKYVDVIVDGKFDKDLADVNYPYAGSINQRVIDVKASLEAGKVILKKL